MKKIYLHSQHFKFGKLISQSLFAVTTLLLINFGLYAQDFYINFYPGSDTISIESIKVENLSNETVYNMSTDDVLHVIESTDARFIAGAKNKCEIFPNPSDASFFVNFFAESDGQVSISIIDVQGRQLMDETFYAAKGFYKTEISGALNGLYFIQIRGEAYTYTEKIAGTASKTQSLHASIAQSVAFSETQNPVTKLGDEYEMPYKYGDVLIFTFISSNGNKTFKPVVINNQGIIADGEMLTLTVNFYKCRDNENYEYSVVEVGEKVWMAENLNTEYFANNSHIKLETSDNSWGQLKTVAFCNYLNSVENSATYGKLYNWHAVDFSAGLCPSGWHVPSDAEWLNLEKNIGVSNTVVGKKGWRGNPYGCYLKANGTDFWSADPNEQTNAAGFFALPAGIRTLTGGFNHKGDYAAWWTSTETDGQNAWCRALRADSCDIYRQDGSKTLGLSIRCVYNDVHDTTSQQVLIPQLITLLIDSVFMESAYFEGEILDNGGGEISEAGFVVDTIVAPTITSASFIVTCEEDAAIFSGPVNGLIPNKVYYVRAFARNSAGIAYGNELNFSTLKKYFVDGSGISDIDGNLYSTMIIGSTEYMTSNLKTSRLNNGQSILRADDVSEWTSDPSPKYCWYDDDSTANEQKNGKLYNKNAINTGRLCPDGWHVPTDSEWKIFEFYLEMSSADTTLAGWRGTDQGAKLKEIGTTNWINPNTGATNQSGFSALGSGSRNQDGSFTGIGEYFCTWTSTMDVSQNQWVRKLRNIETKIYRGIEEEESGFSVRCIKTPITAPFIITGSTSDISISSVIIHSDIVSYDNLEISSKGIVWNTTGDPDLTSYEGLTDEGEGSGQIASVIYNLESATQYYVRAYATNELGTSFGEEISFSTLSTLFAPGPGILDNNNNYYKTVIINNREWMAQNIKSSKSFSTTSSGNSNGYIPETNFGATRDTSMNDSVYGGLFSAFEITQGSRCPNDWLIASEEDWQELEAYLGMSASDTNTMGWRGTNEGGKLKEPGFTNWIFPNTGATNETGFNFKPSGYLDEFGIFTGEGTSCRFWTSGTDSIEPYYFYARELSFDKAGINRIVSNPENKYSLRCVKPSGAPILFTKEVTLNEFDEPSSGGVIISQGGSEITEKGIVWSTEPAPNIYQNYGITQDGTGPDEYTSVLYEIAPGETIYVRAYATNNQGTGYGNIIAYTDYATVQAMLDYGMSPLYIINNGYPIDSLYGKRINGGLLISFNLQDGSGVLCSLADVGVAEWGCEGISIGDTATMIGTGKYNTFEIINACGVSANAATVCNDYENEWYSNWYLPSRDEMLQIFEKNEYLGGLISGQYWTSSESSAQPGNFAICINDGNVMEANKSQEHKFRAISYLNCEPVFDVEGNYYPVIKIGNQAWTGENLRTTKFQNEEPITFVDDATVWVNLSIDVLWTNPLDDQYLGSYSGKLYNHNAVADPRNICPEGWHVPTDNDWDILINFLGGASVAGGKMKNQLEGDWTAPNTDATNISEFNALPYGMRNSDDGIFYYFNEKAFYWSVTQDNPSNSWYRSLQYDDGQVIRNTEKNNTGMNVRCIKD